MEKQIKILQIKLAIILFFSIALSCFLTFLFSGLMVVFGGLLLFVLSCLVIKSQVINKTIRLLQGLTTSEEAAQLLVKTQQKFFDIMAHDLRTPLNGIEGFTNLLIEDEDCSEEDKKIFLKHIIESTTSANKLIDRLSKWSRLQTGRWKIDAQSFEINKLICSIVSFHKANAAHKHVDLIMNLDHTHVVFADQLMIETALRNLVSNAIKFTKSENETHGYVKIRIKKQEKDIVVSIEDNGKGMSPHLINDLFKIEKHVVMPDISGKIGTGLGLILCKEFIEKNGGKIWVTSKPEQGSKFSFTIPLAF